MFGDELAGINPAARILAISRADERRHEFAHLKMQMREILAVGIPDRRNLLTAANLLRRSNQHRVHMRVVGLNVFSRAVFFVGMEDDDDIAPARSALARKYNAAIGYCVNRITKIAVFTADAVEIIAEMAILGKTLCVVSEGAILVPEREIETCCRRQRNKIERRR